MLTSRVLAAIDTGPTMQNLDLDYGAAVAVAILVALGKVIPILFTTLRIAVSEYESFREWLRERPRGGEQAQT